MSRNLTIWKFPLRIDDVQRISMPFGARILTVQPQGDVPCLWALVDANEETCSVEIRTHGTGHAVPDDDRYHYVGTYQVHSGALVFHVFRIGESSRSLAGGTER